MIRFDLLTTLARALTEVPEGQFEFNRWAGEGWTGTTDLSCGTPACAIGWATTMPEFQALGLRLVKVRGQVGVTNREIFADEADHFDAFTESIRTIKHLFGLTHDQAIRLFTPHDEPEFGEDGKPRPIGSDGCLWPRATPAEVGAHITRFVELGGRT